MDPERIPLSDKDLWRRLAQEPGVATAAVSDLDLAAWLEGRLPEAEAARMDAAIGADSELRRAALDIADVLGKPFPDVPARMAVRAQALVGFEAERQPPRRSWLAGLMPAFGAGFALQRGAIAGVAVMVAAVGFVMGGGLGASFVHEKQAVQQPATAMTTVFGSETSSNQINELFTTDSL
jgi:anti-sigma factor RsiW